MQLSLLSPSLLRSFYEFVHCASYSRGFLLSQVHHGFYTAYHNTSLRPGVLSAVQKAKELYGDTKIMVTGHSMGGAMAAFCGLDLRVMIY